MKKIILLYRAMTPSIVRVTERLQCHFGQSRVITSQTQLPAIDDDDVVVALLSASEETGEMGVGGLPLDDPAQLKSSGVANVLAREGTVVPILLDNAVMPAHEALPESVGKLAYRHALPIRRAELDRDLGRLIEDLEVHIDCYPGKVYPWDYWLLPFGIIGSVAFGIYSVTWFVDIRFWSFGYLTVQQYQQARFWLVTFWSSMLGLFLLSMMFAIHFRRYRICARQRAEHFQTGTGPLPEYDHLIVSTATVLAWAAIGLGWWCSLLAILAGTGAIVGRALRISNRFAWGRVVTALGVAILALVFSLWRGSLLNRFESALGEYERGIAAVKAHRLPEAKRHFEMAIKDFPRYGHAYQGLGLVYAESENHEAAYRELSNAIALYPTDSQGLLDPDRKTVAAAYRNRARVAEKLGLIDQAQRDKEMAIEINGGFNIFGGFFRWW